MGTLPERGEALTALSGGDSPRELRDLLRGTGTGDAATSTLIYLGL